MVGKLVGCGGVCVRTEESSFAKINFSDETHNSRIDESGLVDLDD